MFALAYRRYALGAMTAVYTLNLVDRTLIEPRTRARPERIQGQSSPSVRTVLATLWDQKSCRHLSIALILLYTMGFGLTPWYAPTYALMQRLVPNEMRATTLAVVMLLANLIGMGIGPQAVGILSDGLQPQLGQESLRYAMLLLSLVALWAAYHFWRAGRTVGADLSARSQSLVNQ